MKYIRLLWALYRLKNNTKKTRTQIKSQQDQQLYQLLHYAYDHSIYYQTAFTEAGITKQDIDTTPITSFPTTDKRIFMNHFDELVTVNDVRQEELRKFDALEKSDQTFKEKYHVVHSSGSTGNPEYFIYDDKAWEYMLVAIIRGALWDMKMLDILKLLFKTPRVVYIAATEGRYGGAMAVGSGLKGVHAQQLSLDINQPLSEWVNQIHEFAPNIVIGYSSAIKILAEMVVEGKVHVHIERIISCGEPLNSNLRAFLEDTFQCPVVNFYGASESLALGVEMSTEEGMYLFDDVNYIEVVKGKMYLTSLYNYTQPLIRYELSDRLIWSSNDLRYPFRKIKNLNGRNEDLMWFEDTQGTREFLHPLAIEGFCIQGMIDYQFIQNNHTSFELCIEIIPTANQQQIQAEMTTSILIILKDKKLSYVQFSINFVNEILPNKQTGKKQLIVRREGEFE